MEKIFAFDAPAFEIVKSYKDPNGQMFIEGIASTTGIDLTGERMSPEVLAKMASRLIGKPLRSEHGKGWDDKIGKIEQAEVKTDDLGQPALWIKARLNDWSSKARDLFAFLKDGTEKMGLSVAGKINPGGLVREMVESVGKYIPTYKDVEPTEVSVTDHPANLETFAYAVAKSLRLADDDIYDPDEFNKNRLAKLSDLIDLATAVQNDLAKTGAKCQKCGSPLNSVGECSKCLEMYDAPGTQKDHECNDCEGELCEHDKCVNKDCSAEKCSKCYAMAKADLKAGDFLDPENLRYPVAEKFLMPALRYFNKEGQREQDGYDDGSWAVMGQKLAQKLNKLTGDSYRYDLKSEKVVREAVKKEDEKEVNDEMNKHGNLVSKEYPQDVKGLLKSWGKDPEKEEANVQKTEGVKKDEVQKDSKPELFTPGGDSSSSSGSSGSSSDSGSSSSDSGSSSSGSDSSSSGSSDSGSSTSSGSSDSSNSSELSSELSSLMSELKSTLEAMQSSLESSSSSSGSSSSDSSSSDSSSSGSDSSSSDGSSSGSSGSSDKTSTHKAVDASSTSSESSSATNTDQDEVARAVDTLVQAANTMREALAKAKGKGKPKLADQSSEEASDYSSSDNATGSTAEKAGHPANGDDGKPVGAKPKLAGESSEEATDTSASDNTSANVGKALVEAISLMGEMQKSLAKRDEEFSKLVEKTNEETPARKGFAWTLEKKFDGYHDADNNSGISADLLEKIKLDKEVDFDDYYKAKHYGQLPKKYQTAKA